MEPATLEAHTADARGRQTLRARDLLGEQWRSSKSGTCLREEPSCHRRGQLVAPEVRVHPQTSVEGSKESILAVCKN